MAANKAYPGCSARDNLRVARLHLVREYHHGIALRRAAKFIDYPYKIQTCIVGHHLRARFSGVPKYIPLGWLRSVVADRRWRTGAYIIGSQVKSFWYRVYGYIKWIEHGRTARIRIRDRHRVGVRAHIQQVVAVIGKIRISLFPFPPLQFML